MLNQRWLDVDSTLRQLGGGGSSSRYANTLLHTEFWDCFLNFKISIYICTMEYTCVYRTWKLLEIHNRKKLITHFNETILVHHRCENKYCRWLRKLCKILWRCLWNVESISFIFHLNQHCRDSWRFAPSKRGIVASRENGWTNHQMGQTRKIISYLWDTLFSIFSGAGKFFLLCYSMNYRDFSVKSKLIIELFQTLKLSF